MQRMLYKKSKLRLAGWLELRNDMAMSPSKLKIRPFSTAISSAIYNGSWQLTKDC